MLRIYGNPFAAFYWFDDDVMAILNPMVFAALRPPKKCDLNFEAEMKAGLDKSYPRLDA